MSSLLGDTVNPINFYIVLVTVICVVVMNLVMKPKTPTAKAGDDDGGALLDGVMDEGGWADDGDDDDQDADPNHNDHRDGGGDKKDDAAAGSGSIKVAEARAATAASAEAASAYSKATEQRSRPLAERMSKPKPKANDGPYKIGDRVVLRGLGSDAGRVLNGRHGTIADSWDGADKQRYPVDLDVFDTTTAPPGKGGGVSIKVDNLSAEPPLLTDFTSESSRIVVSSNGCLPESYGRAAAFIFSSLRNTVAHSPPFDKVPPEKKDSDEIVKFGWAFWELPEGKGGVYPALRKYLTEGILEKNSMDTMNQQINPEEPEGAYQLVMDSMIDRRAVDGWNVRLSGEFWIVANEPSGTLVVPVCHPRAVYRVVGIRTPLGHEILSKQASGDPTNPPRPPKLRLTLLPWYGRIIHDPYVRSTAGPAGGSQPGAMRVELANPALAEELLDAVELAKFEGRVVERFRQLEVEGGSRVGLPFQPPSMNGRQFVMGPGGPGGANPMQQAAAQKAMREAMERQSPPTDQEKKLVNRLTKFEPFQLQPPPPSAPPGTGPQPPALGVWNFIRKGITEAENPDHVGVVITANGQQIAPFKCSALVPSAIDILLGLNMVSTKVGKRPVMVGIDDQGCFHRVMFLLRDVPGIRVVSINVTRRKKEEGQGGGADSAAASSAE